MCWIADVLNRLMRLVKRNSNVSLTLFFQKAAALEKKIRPHFLSEDGGGREIQPCLVRIAHHVTGIPNARIYLTPYPVKPEGELSWFSVFF